MTRKVVTTNELSCLKQLKDSEGVILLMPLLHISILHALRCLAKAECF